MKLRNLFFSISILFVSTVVSFAQNGLWSIEKAKKWEKEHPWYCGVNYIPSNAINYTAMWDKTSFSPELIDKEMLLMEELGMNCVRVVLQYVVYEDDPDYFIQTFDHFLNICNKHRIKVMPVFFDDCVFGVNTDPKIGKQSEPLEGWYAWAWSPSPGCSMVVDERTHHKLEIYVKDILSRFKDDNRIFVWDLYNEPTNTNFPERSFPLLYKVFKWAREINPKQPITSGMWNGNQKLNDFLIENNLPMKRIIYISIATILMTLSSCDSWLDVNPSDKYSVETFWKTQEHAKAGLMGCYNALTPWNKLHTIEFDMLTSNSMPYNEANGTQAISRGVHLSTQSLIASLWTNCYKGIGRTNTFLENVPRVEMDEKEKGKMIGEAKFLRAFYYLNLVDKFGGVPLIVDAPNAEEHASLPRNTKEECVIQILQDLDDAIAVLPESYEESQLGRVTLGAALALKARVLLYNSRWEDAAATAKQLIDKGTYQLFNDYRHFFSEANKHNCEVIFNIESKLPEYPNCYNKDIQRLNRPAPLKELVDTYLMIDGKTIEESPMYDPERPYENRDPRLLKSIVCIGYPYLGKITTKADVVTTGFGVKKYTSYEDDISIPLVETAAFNFILIRYAEVLLTYAEARNEAVGPDDSVYDAINKLRKRPDINMPEVPKGLTQSQMRDVIRRERRVEFAFEGLYYSDILRWKTAEKENNGFVHNSEGVVVDNRSFDPLKHYLWPIPYNQTILNPNLEQNPNWD